MSVNDAFKKNLRALGTAQAINFIYPVLIFPVVGRNLGASTFGELMGCYAVALALATFVDFGFNFEGPRQALTSRNCARQLSRTLVSITVAKLAICVLAALVAAAYFYVVAKPSRQDPTLFGLVIVPIIVGTALSPQWLLHGLSQLHWLVYLSAGSRAVCFAAYLIVAPDSAYSAALAISAPTLITSLLATPFLPVEGIFHKASFSAAEIARITRSSTPAFLSNISTLPYTQGGTILLNYMHGPIFAGFFSAAERLIRPIISVHGVIFQAAYPTACNQPDSPEIRRKPLRAAYIISACSALMIIWFSDALITHIYTSDFAPATSTLILLTGLLITSPLAMSTAQLRLLASGRGHETYRAYGITSAAYCVVAPVLIYYHAQLGAAVSIILAEILATSLLLAAVRRNHDGSRP